MKVKAKDIGREHIGLHVKDVSGSDIMVTKIISWTKDGVYLEGAGMCVFYNLDQELEFAQPTKTVELTQEEITVILGLIPEKWKYGSVVADIRAKLDPK